MKKYQKVKIKDNATTTQTKHRHKWDDHCDCDYCQLEVCLKCGEERERK